MTRTGRSGLAAAVAFFLLGTAGLGTASAQQLTVGTWAGILTPPGGPALDITLEVSGMGDELEILLVWPDEAPPEAQEMSLQEIELSDGTLTFRLPFPGVRVVCELVVDDDGAYEGDCEGDDGQSGHLLMEPPA